jgi:hypothetical protein
MSLDKDIKKLAKQAGVKPSVIEITYTGSRDEVMKKIKADVEAAKKTGYAVESLNIELKSEERK